MEATAEIAGYVTAQAVQSVSGGETLVPIFAYETPDGKREEERLEGMKRQTAVAKGRESLQANERGASRAVLVSDGYLNLPTGPIDALVIEARDYTVTPPRGFTMALPYRHASKEGGFAVHKPKFLAYDGPQPDYNAIGQGFFRGVEQCEEGAALWAERLDESV